MYENSVATRIEATNLSECLLSKFLPNLLLSCPKSIERIQDIELWVLVFYEKINKILAIEKIHVSWHLIQIWLLLFVWWWMWWHSLCSEVVRRSCPLLLRMVSSRLYLKWQYSLDFKMAVIRIRWIICYFNNRQQHERLTSKQSKKLMQAARTRKILVKKNQIQFNEALSFIAHCSRIY